MHPQVGKIIELVKSIDVDQTNEYMVLSKQGLYFIKIIENKKRPKGQPKFTFEFSSEEHYFSEEHV